MTRAPKKRASSTDLSIMAAMAAASLDALITIDSDGNIVEFGSAAESLFGYSRAEVLGQSVAEIVIPERLRGAHADGMRRYHATGQGPVLNNRVEVPAQRRDGSEFPAELTVVPLEVAGRKMFTAFVRDISEQKAHEAALEEARAQAERASAAKSRFLAHMSHELRSPLNAVLGATELMLDSPLSAEQREYADTVRSSGSALLSLINEVLSFTQLESGQVKLRDEPLDVHELVGAVASAAAASARSRNLEVVQCIDPAVPERVRGDAGRLRQILANLVDNSLKYTTAGGVLLDVAVVGEVAATVRLRLSVEDTGIGIDPADQDRLFDEFTQVDESDSTAFGGVGLGLSIVKRLTELMDGQMGLSSAPGEGSRFWLEAEFRVDEPARLMTPPATTVVLVTPSPIKRRALSRQLEYLGCEVRTHAALGPNDAAELTQCDRVLVDMHCLDLAAVDACLRGSGLDPAHVHPMASPGNKCPAGWGVPLREPLRPRALAALLAGQAAAAPPDMPPSAATGAAHLLLVEDGPTNQLIIGAMLRKAGYAVTVVDDGEAAVAAVKTGDYDLVLMDLRMPVMDGLEACRRLRQLPDLKGKLPILALTANAMEEDIERCVAAGMDDHCGKPIERDVLFAKIRRLLGGDQRPARDCA